MDALFIGAVFAIGIACGVFIVAVGCMTPEGFDAHETLDVRESHPLEAPTQ